MVLRLLSLFDTINEHTSKSQFGARNSEGKGWAPSVLRLGFRESIHADVHRRCSIDAHVQLRRHVDSRLSARSLRTKIMNEVDVLAMTCSGAALRRFLGLSTTMQTLLQWLLKRPPRLRSHACKPMLSYHPDRCIMIGDSMQLAPVVQNELVRQQTSLDMSLFERLQLMGVIPIQLNMQGRACPEICNLYRWRYKQLLDLKKVTAADFRCTSSTSTRRLG